MKHLYDEKICEHSGVRLDESPPKVADESEFEELLEAATSAHEVMNHCIENRCVPTIDEMLNLERAIRRADLALKNTAERSRPKSRNHQQYVEECAACKLTNYACYWMSKPASAEGDEK